MQRVHLAQPFFSIFLKTSDSMNVCSTAWTLIVVSAKTISNCFYSLYQSVAQEVPHFPQFPSFCKWKTQRVAEKRRTRKARRTIGNNAFASIQFLKTRLVCFGPLGATATWEVKDISPCSKASSAWLKKYILDPPDGHQRLLSKNATLRTNVS